jgi:microsomal dipeptidase-like Zn-dependent dipeptidase
LSAIGKNGLLRHRAQGGLTISAARGLGAERCNILIDVSHLNDQGFWGFADCKKPFSQRISNARAVANCRGT